MGCCRCPANIRSTWVLAPVVLPAKIMLQELCRRNFIIHYFSDASEQGYGTVTYLRIQNSNGDIHVAFLMGKARITPLNAITVPSLELTAAVFAVHVDLMLKKVLRLRQHRPQTAHLCSSMSWMRTSVFILWLQIVSIIREATKTSHWQYVGSKENPADDASRERRARDFIRAFYPSVFPKFLCKPEEYWPENIVHTAVGVDDLEVKKEAFVNVVNTQGSLKGTNQLMAYFSDWRKTSNSSCLVA